ncbi:MAG: hypothetical protein A2X86_20835 [Bdellovibrionales bacterium GWA2_49_15]|nr:MAG: hypothetical protein A2X86_20835 [Bdellovibrionales bacterium GWA2_49_15]HAZ13155.1 hypothetical protein [Bdellovibrionales bacterium]
MKICNLFFLCITLIFVSCSSISVKEDYDPKFNYSKLKEYSWQIVDSESPIKLDSLITERVHQSVDQQLQLKGYKKVEAGKGEFFVNYHYLEKEVIERHRGSAGFGVGSTLGSDSSFGSLGLGIPFGPARVHEIETLVIDIIDATSGKLIWHAQAQEKLLDSTPQETSANFIKVVEAIMAKFPPS